MNYPAASSAELTPADFASHTSSDYSNLCNPPACALQWQAGLRNLWIKKADGKIRLIFSSSSEYELTGWALSFADEARVVKPRWLAREIEETVGRMQGIYTNKHL